MRTYGQFCGLARALDHVGDRWTLLIVRELLVGPRRFTDLHANLPGLATNLLAERLRRLAADGLVERRKLGPPGAATVYELTARGRSLEPAVLELIRFGGLFMDAPAAGDAFRADWLALALRAMLPTVPPVELTAQLHAGETALVVRTRDSVDVHPGAVDRPDVTVTANETAMLGLFAGRIAIDEVDVSGDRDALERLLRAAPGDYGPSAAATFSRPAP